MKLTHEAFKCAGPRLVDAAHELVNASEGENREKNMAAAAGALLEHWRLLTLACEEHSKHEDQVG